MVSAKPCCERCESKFRNRRNHKTLIYQHYGAIERKQVSQHAKPSCETCETSETTLIAMLQSELEHKNQQLEVKDEQIRELNARLAEVSSALVAAQQTAQAAQALHAGTIQQQLTSGTDQSEGSGDKPKKQGWFSRLFRG